MTAYGENKVAKCRDAVFEEAMLYDPSGVGGLHMMYVVPRGEMLGDYGLAGEPGGGGCNVSCTMGTGGSAVSARWPTRWAGVIGGFLYWLRTGAPALAGARGRGRRGRADRRRAGSGAARAEKAEDAAAPPEAADRGQRREPVRVGRDRTRLESRYRGRRDPGGRRRKPVERVFERANQRYGAEGSLVHQARTLDDLLHGGMVHQCARLHEGWHC